MQARLTIEPGTRMGQFEIRGELGRGAFGDVYRAYNDVRKAEVALKVVFPELANAESAFRQLVHECDVRDRIRDLSNVLRASTPIQAEYQGLAAILLEMPLAEGSLRDVLKARPHGGEAQQQWLNETLESFKQACGGLAAIHEAGLTHLDVKPENLLLCRENGRRVVKLTDFGLARASGELEDARRGVGTPAYMAPEQFDGRAKDMAPDADVYAMGCILFEILDGSVPFEAGSIDEFKQMHALREPPMHRWQDVPVAFRMITAKCLAKKPQERYGTAALLLKDIRRAQLGMSLSMDVSCPTCGHINDDAWTVVCESPGCRTNLSSRFHPCPQCGRDVRLDQDTCKCKFEVGAYYLFELRWKRAQQLKEQDLPEAIELLELILHDGAEEYEEQAAVLVRDLRNKQREVGNLVHVAASAETAGQFAKALETWHDVLRIVPQHRAGLVKVRELEGRIEMISVTKKSAGQAMDSGEFQDAESLLARALEQLPALEELTALLVECRARAESYQSSLAAVREAYAAKQITRALAHVTDALAQAPAGEDAVRLQRELTALGDRNLSRLDKARRAIDRAQFSAAVACLSEIRTKQEDCTQISVVEKALARAEPPYEKAMAEGREAFKQRELDKALRAFEAALKVCPESADAEGGRSKAEEDIGQTRKLVTAAVKALRSAAFDRVEALIREVETLWPTTKELGRLRAAVPEVLARYEPAMKQARAARGQLDLEAARQAVKSALTACPQSEEAINLEASIAGDLSKVEALLASAQSASNKAEFRPAQQALESALALWPNSPRAVQASVALKSAESEYPARLSEARSELAREQFDRARGASARARHICPRSAALIELDEQIDAAQNAFNNRVADEERRLWEAQQFKIKVKTWATIVAAGGIAAVLALIAVPAFGRWLVRHVWPGIVESAVMLSVFITVGCGLLALFKRKHDTSVAKACAGKALVLQAMIAFAALLLFSASFRSALAIGVVIGGPVAVLLTMATVTSGLEFRRFWRRRVSRSAARTKGAIESLWARRSSR